MTRLATAAIVVGVAFSGAVATMAQTAETFKATASLKKGTTSITSEMVVSIQRYASEEARAAMTKAVRDGGSAAAHKALVAMADVGFIQVGEQKAPIKFAVRRPTPTGAVITVLTGAPLAFIGAGLPGAKPKSGSEVAVAILVVTDDNAGLGELAPAAQVKMNAEGAFLLEDYGDTVIWLNGVARAR